MAVMHPGAIADFEGNYVPTEEAKISIMTHAFNYGTGLFEGIRGYYNQQEDNILVFRLPEHVDRMVRNAKVLCMDISEDAKTIENNCVE
ncbi:MAG: branched chain amino acid aminotransferase, partial [Candidatus Hydrogenedentes bacterium]|nr:branched chain amino acid aminotransferase [Candidatus Hydrogenedentota bacterium]